MQKIETIYGDIAAPDWQDDLIVRSLIELGEWSYNEQLLASQLVRKGDVIWDGGAFLGTFGIGITQIAARANRAPASLLAIEPGEELGACLKANLGMLAPCRTQFAPFAVGPECGHLMALSNGDTDSNHGALAYAPVKSIETPAGNSLVGDQVGGRIVESKALWQLRAEFGDYDFLKLDVEGMERAAIVSDFDYLKARKPVIWAECNEALSSILVLEALLALGYEPVYLAFPAFRPNNFRVNSNLPHPLSYEAVLIGADPDLLAGLDTSVTSEIAICRSVRTSWDLRQALWATPRWSAPEWVSMTKPEMVALIGRLSRGEVIGKFLNDRADATTTPD